MMKLKRITRGTIGTTTALALALGLTPGPAAAKPARECGTRAECRKKAKEAALQAARDEALAVALAAALEVAEEERREVLKRAEARQDGGENEAALVWLEEAADERGDAVLAVEAAEAALALPGRAGVARARSDALRARELIAEVPDFAAEPTLDPASARVAFAAVPELLERCDAVEAAVNLRVGELNAAEEAVERVSRRGRQETRAGAAILSLGIGGLGLLGWGMGVEYDRQRKLDPIRDREADFDLTGLDDQHDRANTMIAAGAVVGGLGLSLGAALVALGVRDRRRARALGPRAGRDVELGLAPSPGGVTLVGRF